MRYIFRISSSYIKVSGSKVKVTETKRMRSLCVLFAGGLLPWTERQSCYVQYLCKTLVADDVRRSIIIEGVSVISSVTDSGVWDDWTVLYAVGTLCESMYIYSIRPTDVYDTIRYDITILTCAQKRTSSQLSLPHGTVN